MKGKRKGVAELFKFIFIWTLCMYIHWMNEKNVRTDYHPINLHSNTKDFHTMT